MVFASFEHNNATKMSEMSRTRAANSRSRSQTRRFIQTNKGRRIRGIPFTPKQTDESKNPMNTDGSETADSKKTSGDLPCTASWILQHEDRLSIISQKNPSGQFSNCDKATRMKWHLRN
jgi:hypothetical protein